MLRPKAAPAVSLPDAARHVPASRLGGPLVRGALRGLSLASGDVRPGDLFIALPGATTHGARYAGSALAAGALAVLTDEAGAALLNPETPRIVAENPRAKLGEFAAWFYGYPARRLKLVGVTGTNGKTSTAHLVEAALAAGFGKVALLGTISSRIDGEEMPSARTTLEAPPLQAAFAAMVERGVSACVMEVSSHALAQHRVDGFRFDVAAFTNLSRDHLDYHGSMERYFEAKAALFTPAHARRGVINLEDHWGRRLAAEASIEVETLATQPPADWVIRAANRGQLATPFQLVGPGGLQVAAEVHQPGHYNLANAALALVSAMEAGVGGSQAAAAISALRAVPGRMEVVTAGVGAPSDDPGDAAREPGGQPAVVVDYAHAPDAIAKVLAALRPVTEGKLIVVLGAGGDRDHGKRELMGANAAAGADLVIITDDNPRGEDPAAIRAALLAGAGAGAREVADRADGIGQAI
ncbi:MAG: UDP-N-acetylmuramoyl-L-alanyl-D-glutamate--2,6-diaminopimelate ligase, partial [Bifidobacteriaceae bacterium]|nr:UDP-N-acetylmuramoyl-L-alanyl-D-glutamate--2,6-diaminopimelate ligase [Bifidobacteriaceae bacterium]